ncbi:putative Proteasome subunit beta type-3 [Paratrimastix pyriformis]|uniref:Proteasome subunit beta type-3 n=1 Tax=Paratrimastix pyriformis TaxID=342808 RepID=A0ABQ8UPX2_9EUKA|nr:putative Proteasome subunit beta type-3 [Paratrimastix pyriformis]|eukprot:GAFH01003900.1.p2 GENE.GAFH01003900.1~~GAFH01003900.1.p2  ORF type:complete len:205 (-),score=33.38 GAFH01003900.1:207-821(-)
MSDPMSYNGGTVLAMNGKNCCAIASDLRFGVNNIFVGRMHRIFPVGKKILVGYSGLASDCQTLNETIQLQTNLYSLREGRQISPHALTNLISTDLYEHRFGPLFVEPIVCGLDEKNEPYVCGADLLGCLSKPTDFIVSGTGMEMMMGACESFWRPDMEPEELLEVISQCFLAGLDRDALSGWGCVVHVITPTHTRTVYLKSRQD